MFERYKSKIERYCDDLGVEIPIGFRRHDACRYAVIDFECSPPKLIAMTWSSADEAASYLLSGTAVESVKVLDFEERREMLFTDRGNLVKGPSF